MNFLAFGVDIRATRDARQLPLRLVAARLDTDTSTLSNGERGEKSTSLDYLISLSGILLFDLKEFQMILIVDKIRNDFDNLEHLAGGPKESGNLLEGKKKK